MKGEELLNAMEHIDAELIEAADRPVKKRSTVVRFFSQRAKSVR